MKSLRALLRVAWRDAARHRTRTLLAMLLIALPVALIVAGASVIEALREGPDARAQRVMGRAELRVEGGDFAALATLDAPSEVLAAGEETIDELSARFVVLEATTGLDGLAAGMVDVVGGDVPRAPHQVALSTWLASALDVTIGDSVTLHDGNSHITGLVRDTGQLDLALIVRVAPHDTPPFGAPFALIDSASPHVVETLRAAGFGVTRRRDVVIIHDAFESSVLFGLGGLASFFVALTLGATFASQRPRRHERITLLAATGAAPAALFIAELLGALALAATACVLGAVVGMTLSMGVHPFLDVWTQRIPQPLHVPFTHLAGAWLLVSVTTVVVLALPTWKVTQRTRQREVERQGPVRRGPAGVSLIIGAAFIALAWTVDHDAMPLLALAGAVLWVIGTLLAVPAVLTSLARHASRLPLAWRLAVRDTSRLRDRHAPVVAGVAACMTLVALLAIFGRSVELMLSAAAPRAPLASDQLIFTGPGAAQLANELGATAVQCAASPLLAASVRGATLRASIATQSPALALDGWIAVGDNALFEALGVADSHPDLVAWTTEDTPRVAFVVNGVEYHASRVPRAPLAEGPLAVASLSFADAQGWSVAPPPGASLTPHVVRMGTPLSPEQRQQLEARAERLGTRVSSADTTSGPRVHFDGALLTITLAVAIAVIALAAGLTIAESQRDAARLHTLGASPTTLTTLHAARACYIALVGCMLALPAAVLPLLALLRLGDVSIDISVPWTRLIAAFLGLPLLAVLGAGLCAPRRASRVVTTPHS